MNNWACETKPVARFGYAVTVFWTVLEWSYSQCQWARQVDGVSPYSIFAIVFPVSDCRSTKALCWISKLAGGEDAQLSSQMARWLVRAASSGGLATSSQSWVAVLSTVLVFCLCVAMLLALCAARAPQVLDLNHPESRWPASEHLSSREPEGELAVESRRLSHRFSSTSAITKLGASFRISSFRTDCRSQVDVVDALRRSSRPAVEEMSTEPAVWQRVILRGERCAPLSFSGLILYDEHGSPLPSTTTTAEDQQDQLPSNQKTMAPSSSKEDLLD